MPATFNHPGTTKRFLLWLPVAVYMAAIFYVSSQSSPPAPGGVPDYVLHGVEFMGLSILTFRAVAGGLPAHMSRSRVVLTLLMTVGYGISDEIHQMFVPLRTPDVRDVLYDLAGAVFGLLLCWAWHIISSRRARLPLE